MIFKQFYLGCLAHASYLVGADGEAAVVDPQRDVDQYIAFADANGLRICWVIETHLHADFVSGHRELAARTGATIAIGAKAGATFPHHALADGETLPLGDIELRVLETPGHTPESICVLIAEGGKVGKVLTGDTLFIGDVGRPDLAGGAGYSPREMASMLYDTLHEKLLALPDDVEVFPAHGAGSLCGRNISKETSSTIGEQRRFNYALQPMAKEAFVDMMTTDLAEPPRYFARDAEINRAGAPALGELPRLVAIDPAATDLDELTVLDVRPARAFGAGHIGGAFNIGLGGQYASWAGSLLPATRPIVLVADSTDGLAEARMRLARVGVDHVLGFVELAAWTASGLPLRRMPQISVQELSERIAADPDLAIVDVRGPGEYAGGHALGAESMPLPLLTREGARLDAHRPIAVICAGGYRSSIGTSILERLGFTAVVNVVGGTDAWRAAGLPMDRPSARGAA